MFLSNLVSKMSLNDDNVSDENKYPTLVNNIIEHGISTEKKISVFGAQLEYDLRNKKFPLFISKRYDWAYVIEELLWCIRGETDRKNINSRTLFYDPNDEVYIFKFLYLFNLMLFK
ncbi:thymidylate synthase-like protein [Glossina pallidipes salivary gland hypertrophy virus]|uniref:Thymidylate synthase-like protein n=2 Tax=Glossina hytrovirus (isolate Glossina pallidipes/Ethiopia/Seibersdorf/-) TaxID=379529 RepID=A0A110AML3_GHVS|nr:thymidylate synthase [Glossina pallidipes salivary gland hypertrophy virus]ABQ08809.1 thymidylate synthase [Glossina pallidipes salivary gland hypertrophy virus]AMB48641.1 thymidylate synthase-like protein [Glossina pallidipes salivary gland hypertrophy virus]